MYKLFFGVDCNGSKIWSKDVYSAKEEADRALQELHKESPNIIVEVVKVK